MKNFISNIFPNTVFFTEKRFIFQDAPREDAPKESDATAAAGAADVEELEKDADEVLEDDEFNPESLFSEEHIEVLREAGITVVGTETVLEAWRQQTEYRLMTYGTASKAPAEITEAEIKVAGEREIERHREVLAEGVRQGKANGEMVAWKVEKGLYSWVNMGEAESMGSVEDWGNVRGNRHRQNIIGIVKNEAGEVVNSIQDYVNLSIMPAAEEIMYAEKSDDGSIIVGGRWKATDGEPQHARYFKFIPVKEEDK